MPAAATLAAAAFVSAIATPASRAIAAAVAVRAASPFRPPATQLALRLPRAEVALPILALPSTFALEPLDLIRRPRLVEELLQLVE